MGFYEDLEIDEYNLVEEWQHQARLYMKYAQIAVDAQDELDKYKDKLDVRTAQIEMEIRNGAYLLLPDNWKQTDKSVAALLTVDPELIKMKEEYNQHIKEAALAKKQESSFYVMRKAALENIVILTGREQYSEPRDKSNNMHNNYQTDAVDKLNNKLRGNI